MRNIALLEWGPSSLYHMLPREKVRVRTAWMDGGPSLPPFLSMVVEGNHQSLDSAQKTVVRYALSAFEDLNAAIRNLRKCFGFPQQDCIGYLNTLTRTYRARPEHESLVDIIRRWAQLTNVDAILWIDYAKQNLPAGSFKVGAKNSRPFSKHHMEFCASASKVLEPENDEESEAWSDIDNDLPPLSGMFPVSPDVGGHQPSAGVSQSTVFSHPLAIPVKSQRSCLMALRSTSLCSAGATSSQEAQVRFDRSTFEEDRPPAYGSIYTRSIGPGPGGYDPDGITAATPQGPAFLSRGKNVFGQITSRASKVPGPGKYTPRMPKLGESSKMGTFERTPKLVATLDVSKKLPFISPQASKCEGHGVHSPSEFRVMPPERPCIITEMRSPNYSFSRSRRLF